MTTVEVRSYSRNSGRIWWEIESGTRKGSSALATASSFCGFAKEKSSEIATDCGLAAPICAASERNSSPVGDGQDFAVAGGALVDAEAEILRNQRLDAVEEEVVELGAGLASDFDGVFEASSGDERGARAFALEQRVGADCRAVEEDEFACVVNFMKGFDDGLRGIGGCRKNFQHAEAAGAARSRRSR